MSKETLRFEVSYGSSTGNPVTAWPNECPELGQHLVSTPSAAHRRLSWPPPCPPANPSAADGVNREPL